MFLIIIIILANIDLTTSQNISHGRNILLGKPTGICSFSAAIPSLHLTDGDLLTSLQFNCNYYTPIRLSSTEFATYMIIYTGERGQFTSDDVHTLDELEIQCSQGTIIYGCARISAPIRMFKNLENGIHLSFMNEWSGSVGVNVLGVNLSEIEIYIRDDVTHRGCFKNVQGENTSSFEGFEKCQTDCEQSVFGISKPLSSCLCLDGFDFENEVALSECGAVCDDNSSCGGDNAHTVYIQEYHIPAFSGCPFKNVPLEKVKQSGGEVRLEIPIIDLTFSKCVRHCGLGITIFWNGSCGCATSGFGLIESPLINGSHIVFHKTRSCDIPCVFDEQNACGGEYGISVYRSCATTKPILCDKLLNCKRGIFDHHGVCIHGCKAGFEGKHCMGKAFVRGVQPTPGVTEVTDEPDEEIDIVGVTKSTIKPTESDKSESVMLMAGYISSIWVPSIALLILF